MINPIEPTILALLHLHRYYPKPTQRNKILRNHLCNTGHQPDHAWELISDANRRIRHYLHNPNAQTLTQLSPQTTNPTFYLQAAIITGLIAQTAHRTS